MVIEDVSAPTKPADHRKTETPKPSETSSSKLKSAAPVDRLAALMADVVLLVPIISLVTSLLRRHWEISYLVGDAPGAARSAVLITFVSVITVIAYQTLFLVKYGATPGKRILGLKVTSIWGSPLTAKQAFFRSFVWSSSAIAMFLPWIGVLSNERRRPWHDRIADTEVVAINEKQGVGAPDSRELAVANALTSFVFCCAIGTLLLSFAYTARVAKPGTLKVAVGSDNAYLCAQVSDAQDEWLEPNGKKPSRMDTAIALYAVGAVGRDCVEDEAENALWNKGEKSLAYLAKAVVRDADDDEGSEYLEKVCKGKQAVPLFCQFGILRRSEDLALKSKALDLLVKYASAYAFTRVAVIDELIQERRFCEAMSLVDQASVPRQFSYFFARSRAIALWGMHKKDDARIILRASLDGLSLPERVQMARWSCEMETLDGCSETARYSCQTLSSAVTQTPAELEDEAVAFSWIRASECLTGNPADHQKLKNFAPGEVAQSYLAALSSLKAGKVEDARTQLKEVMKSAKVTSPAWYEAHDHLIGISSQEELLQLAAQWLEIEDKGDLGWIRTGRSLYRKLANPESDFQALRIGQALVDANAIDEQTAKQVIAATYKTGDAQNALRMWREHLPKNSIVTARAPASEGHDHEFDRIEKDLAALKVGPVAPAEGQK